ncbi:ABC transporter substrate-binding protein [Paenarthrobacter nicotinovorans]|uniref:ABC transporter substrate-binding protein n=2 Tax=Paenarthrobacter nicotinovorans TaxID=29320 RepID=A0ABV0GXH4_PAENI|nr:ABC transporter substrate-binding protein [Paenarthrobacter nicotinovorans]
MMDRRTCAPLPAKTDHQIIVWDVDNTQTTSPGFFAARASLVDYAVRALNNKVSHVSFLFVDGRHVRRIRIETAVGHRLSTVLTAESTPPPFGLTVRELEVASCVAGGLSNPEIAELFHCARRTVATHIEHILTKLNVASRAAVAALIAAANAYVAPLCTTRIELPEDLRQVLLTQVAERRGPASLQRAASMRPIRLASIFPEGIAGRHDVGSMRRGSELAVARLNRIGGVNGRPVEHVAIETSAESLARVVGNMQDIDMDAFTLGNFPLPAASAALHVASRSGTPLLHGMVNPALSHDVMENSTILGNTFQVCATEIAYLSGFSRTLSMFVDTGQWEPPGKSVALVVRQSSLARASVEDLQREVENSGWKVGLVITVDDSEPNLAKVAAEVSLARPAAAYISVFPERDLEAFIGGLKTHGSPPLVYTAWSPTVPNFAARLGRLAEGLVWSTVIGTYDDPVSAPFRKLYTATYAQDPGSGGAAMHFDMVNVLASAWSQVNAPWDFEVVKAALRDTVYRGAAGPYYFGGAGQRALSFPDDTLDASLGHMHLVHQIQGGLSKLIGPPPLASHKFVALEPDHKP